jgi:MFS family permease
MVIALLCTVQFVAVLDTTIVAVALPDIQRELGFGDASLQWVATAYPLAFGGLLIAAGRAGVSLDLPGAAAVTAALAALAASAVLFIAFARIERRARDPLLPLDVLHSSAQVGAVLGVAVILGLSSYRSGWVAAASVALLASSLSASTKRSVVAGSRSVTRT